MNCGKSRGQSANPSEVLEELRKAGAKMTPTDIRQQKVSFIMGSVKEESNITRSYVEEVLDGLEGKLV